MTPLVPVYVGFPGLIGLILSLFKKNMRIFALSILALLTGSILFMSTFYSADMRYIYHAIPVITIGFALFFETIPEFISKNFADKKHDKINTYIISGILGVLILVYGATNAMRLKSAVMINLKYAETPWYYISVQTLNDYFKNNDRNAKKPIVISALIPYYVDFFANGNYRLLPLSRYQEFPNHRDKAWGKNDYSNLIKLYERKIKEGNTLYIHNYGLGNEKPLQNDFQTIMNHFESRIVKEGCFGACNIWRISLKK
jgi:hypothetical protein